MMIDMPVPGTMLTCVGTNDSTLMIFQCGTSNSLFCYVVVGTKLVVLQSSFIPQNDPSTPFSPLAFHRYRCDVIVTGPVGKTSIDADRGGGLIASVYPKFTQLPGPDFAQITDCVSVQMPVRSDTIGGGK